MGQITGQFVDSVTGKPLNGVEMDFFATGDLSGTPIYSDQSNADGTFNVNNAVLDNPACVINVSYPGYQQMLGQPGVFQGTVTLTPSTAVQMITSVPWWVWIAVAVALLFVWKKYGHKIKL